MADRLNVTSYQLAVFACETVLAAAYIALLSIVAVFLSIHALIYVGEYVFDFGSVGINDGWPGIVLVLCVVSGFSASFGIGCITAKPLWKKLTSFGLNGRENG